MIGHRFVNFIPGENSKTKFEQMLDIFTQLLNYTSGDASEALDWMNQLDRTHKFTDDNYGVGDFIELSPHVRDMLRDLRRKHPSILIQKIINLNFDNSENPPSYDFRVMKRLYSNIASGNLNTIHSEIVEIISPYKELKKELQELQLLFTGKNKINNTNQPRICHSIHTKYVVDRY